MQKVTKTSSLGLVLLSNLHVGGVPVDDPASHQPRQQRPRRLLARKRASRLVDAPPAEQQAEDVGTPPRSASTTTGKTNSDVAGSSATYFLQEELEQENKKMNKKDKEQEAGVPAGIADGGCCADQVLQGNGGGIEDYGGGKNNVKRASPEEIRAKHKARMQKMADDALDKLRELDAHVLTLRNCTDYGPWQADPGFDDLEAVCGNNFHTFRTQHALDCAKAKDPSLDKLHDGPCLKNCNFTTDSKPVCGSDGATYENESVIACANKELEFGVEKWYDGECTGVHRKTAEGAANVGELEVAMLRSGQTEHCVATQEVAPVCGDDGKTYGNASKLRCSAASGRHPRLHKVWSHGRCEDLITAVEKQTATWCPKMTEDFNPVCATNGHTYFNPSALRCVVKNSWLGLPGRKLEQAHLGKCAPPKKDDKPKPAQKPPSPEEQAKVFHKAASRLRK